MHSPADIDWERLDRWVRRDGTAEELEVLRRFVEADPDLVALAEAMRTVGQVAGAEEERAWDTLGRWQRLQRQIRQADRPLRLALGDVDVGRPRRRWLRPAVVAALVVLTAGVSLWVVRGRHGAEEQVVSTAPMREVVTRRGERMVIELPDGSRMVVAPESRLRVPASYRRSDGRRDVYLDQGDAFFTVEHNTARPFRVHTVNGMAQDLGTEFLVSAWPAIRRTRVVVVSGEVGLWQVGDEQVPPRPLFTLVAGQLGQVDSLGSGTVASNVKTSQYVAWVDGILVFDETPLDEVVATLGRWYNLDIQLRDASLARRRVTARIQNQSVSGVLESITLSLGLHIEHRDTTVVVSVEPR